MLYILSHKERKDIYAAFSLSCLIEKKKLIFNHLTLTQVQTTTKIIYRITGCNMALRNESDAAVYVLVIKIRHVPQICRKA
jgi:hypothetical protein